MYLPMFQLPPDESRRTGGVDLHSEREVVLFMPMSYERAFPVSFRRAGFLFLILVVCLCVFAQMLGTPITLASVLTADQDLESASEDLLLLPSALRPILGSRIIFSAKHTPLRDRQNFEVLVYRPPQP